jgi:cobalt-zinc-cadmium efflux system protein
MKQFSTDKDLHPQSDAKLLAAAATVTASFFIIELVGGILTNSLVLLADAWHMLNDCFALIFALAAVWIAKRPVNLRKTFGYYRAEILAAFLNGIFLWAVVIFIFYEAIQRVQRPEVVESLDMLVIAASGFIANGASAFVLSKSRSESLNVKGAFIHVLADALGSIGAVFAGLVMLFTAFYEADALASMMIGLLILFSSWKLVRESLNVLLEGVPYSINVRDVERKIMMTEGVKEIHDLHVWCITPAKICALSCHVVVETGANRRELLSNIISMLKDEFGIDHTTVQMEDEGYPKAASEH